MRAFRGRAAISFILILLLTAMCVLPATAAETPTVSISSGEVKAGESVMLKVSIANNPGLAAAMLYIYYDTDTFTVDPDSDISASGRFANNGMLMANTIERAKANGRYDGKSDEDGVLALWFNGSGKDVSGDGVVMTVNFKAKSTALNGEYDICLGYSAKDTSNGSGNHPGLRTVNGEISVTGGNNGDKPEEAPKTEEDSEDVPQTDVPNFTDVAGNWAETYIAQAAALGLIQGYEGLYRPNDTMTRAEFVTILWRAVGSPAPAGPASFTDLTQDWYKDAVAWAEQNSVVNGMGEGKFEPTGSVTREQLVTILHRMQGAPTGMEAFFTGMYDEQYPDSGNIGDWAKAGLYWSIYNSIYCGEQSESIGTTLAPKGLATRAQIAVMIVRYLDKY